MTLPRRLLAVVGVVGVLASLAACSPTVALKPGPNAADPRCADVMVNLPSPLAGQDRVWTDAQSTAAWGDPTTIYMTCGVEEPAVSLLPCTTVGGIDWLVDESERPWYRVTSFGRSPAIQMYINQGEYVDSSAVLQRIANTMRDFPRTAECTDKPTS